MKKSLKTRLTLNRETLRNLASDQLPGAQGGGLEPVTNNTCPQLNTNINCPVVVSRTCPTNCGQWYCYGV